MPRPSSRILPSETIGDHDLNELYKSVWLGYSTVSAPVESGGDAQRLEGAGSTLPKTPLVSVAQNSVAPTASEFSRFFSIQSVEDHYLIP